MLRRVAAIALECVLELGITVLQATQADLLIVAISAADDPLGRPRWWR